MSDNRFDFLRLVFASTVFVYHMLVLALSPSKLTASIWAGMAELSIQGFFIVSGALVYGSLQRSSSLGLYAEKRIRRLYPAYAVVILVPTLYALMKTGAVDHVARYLGANLIFLNFLEPTLPGLFEANAQPEVNGALWTLKIEVMFYIILPLLSWILSRSARLTILTIAVIYVGAEAWRLGMEWLALRPHAEGLPADALFWQLARQLPGQMSFFVSGIALWLLRDIARKRWFLTGIVGAGYLLTSYTSFLEPLRAAGLAMLIAAIAYAPGPRLNAAKFGDISYGVYITHFPIVQALVAAGLFAASPALGIVTSVILVVAASFILWRVIERPMLRRDSHYRRAESKAPDA